MNEFPVSVRNYSYMYSSGKGAARQQAQKILKKSQSISGYLVVTRAIGKEGLDGKCMWLSIGIHRWQGIATAKGTRVSGKHRRVSSKSSDEAGDHLELAALQEEVLMRT